MTGLSCHDSTFLENPSQPSLYDDMIRHVRLVGAVLSLLSPDWLGGTNYTFLISWHLVDEDCGLPAFVVEGDFIIFI